MAKRTTKRKTRLMRIDTPLYEAIKADAERTGITMLVWASDAIIAKLSRLERLRRMAAQRAARDI